MNEEYDGHDIDLDGHLTVQVVSECAFCLLFFSAQTTFSQSFFASVIGGRRHHIPSKWLFAQTSRIIVNRRNSSLLGLHGSTGRSIQLSHATPNERGLGGRLERSMIGGTD